MFLCSKNKEVQTHLLINLCTLPNIFVKPFLKKKSKLKTFSKINCCGIVILKR